MAGTTYRLSSQQDHRDLELRSISESCNAGTPDHGSPANAVEAEPIPPNGGYGWVCTFAVFMINAHTWGINAVRNYTLPTRQRILPTILVLGRHHGALLSKPKPAHSISFYVCHHWRSIHLAGTPHCPGNQLEPEVHRHTQHTHPGCVAGLRFPSHFVLRHPRLAARLIPGHMFRMGDGSDIRDQHCYFAVVVHNPS